MHALILGEKIVINRRILRLGVAVLFLVLSGMAYAQVDISNGGVSGQWYNPARDGEGIFLEVVRTDSGQQVSVSWFTYDLEGFQMWLVGNVPISGDTTTVTIPVVVTSGAKFGDAYNPADVQRQSWGTLTLTFDNCNSGLLSYTSSVDGFGSGAIELTRLTNLTQVQCDDPPPPSGTGITPGRWIGEGVCFNVSADGRTVTVNDSLCDGGRSAFDSDINSFDQNDQPCDAEVECKGTYAIINNGFSCPSDGDDPGIAVGSFVNGNSASGAAQETEGQSICTANWTATPNNP